ncbi:MAG: glycosyltransferase family 2 protein [Candidatus Omnitrophica bacterium]|nr:glycosyltransferase family 2 protein [Candidatus Omnitrophota bacterium]
MISIICPVHNGLSCIKKYMKYLIASINFSGHKDDIKIIFVDDGSTDGTADWFKDNYPNIVVLKGDGNLWWSGAVNVGVKYALNNYSCDYILLWNHDTKPAVNYFKELYIIIKSLKNNIIVLSKIYYLDRPNVIFNMGCLFDKRKGMKKLTGFNQVDSEKYHNIVDADWSGGMGTLIPSSVFRKIGFFDNKNFPQYHGDSDFTLRAGESGFKLLAFPMLKIWNDESNTGKLHNGSFVQLIKTLFDIKSPQNVIIEFKFYKRHCNSLWAYMNIMKRMFYYVGGYFKHKIIKQ